MPQVFVCKRVKGIRFLFNLRYSKKFLRGFKDILFWVAEKNKLLKFCDIPLKYYKFKQLCIYILQLLNRFNISEYVYFLTFFRYGLCMFVLHTL